MTLPINSCLIEPPATGRAVARRRKVIDTARLLFSDNGFHATGIAQIAKQSGVAVGQIYRDFASKEEIVAAIAQADCASFMAGDSLNDAVARRDSASVRAWIHSFVDPQEKADDGRMFAEILAESSRNERIARIFTSVQEEARTNMITALSLFAPGAEMSAQRTNLADTILTLSLGLIHHRLMHRNTDIAALTASLTAIVDREIASLEMSGAEAAGVA